MPFSVTIKVDGRRSNNPDPAVHNKTFTIDTTPCAQFMVDYSALLNKNFNGLTDYREYPIELRKKIGYFIIFACKETNYSTYAEILDIQLDTFKKFGSLSKNSKPMARFQRCLLKSDLELSRIKGHQKQTRFHMLEKALLLLIRAVKKIIVN